MNALILAVALASQALSFESNNGYGKVIGTKEQQLQFFDEWRECVDPNWRTGNSQWWVRQREMFINNFGWQKNLLFQKDKNTRLGLARMIVNRGYWVRFLVEVHPFGGFWIYFNFWLYQAVIAVALVGAIWLIRSRKTAR